MTHFNNLEQQAQPFQVASSHRMALASLKLAVYAIDAMRVLHRIELHASMSADFNQAIRAACPDWRNPGWCEDPADLLVSVMTHATDTMDGLMRELDGRFVDGAGQT